MAILVALVIPAGSDLDHNQHYDITDKVRKRVDGISSHRGTPANDSGDQLGDSENDIRHRAPDRHPYY